MKKVTKEEYERYVENLSPKVTRSSDNNEVFSVDVCHIGRYDLATKLVPKDGSPTIYQLDDKHRIEIPK